MKVSVNKIGGPVLDISPYLDSEQDFYISKERERNAFVRVNDDVTLFLSNMSDVLSSFFTTLISTDRVEMRCYNADGTVSFLGELDYQSSIIKLKTEKISITAFSKTKLFWDWAKKNMIAPIDDRYVDGTYNLNTATLPNVIAMNVAGAVAIDIITGVAADSAFANQKVGIYYEYYDSIPGLYYCLDPTTTIEKFLLALCKGNNAEFIIDPNTGELLFQPRLATNGTKTDISNLLEGEEDIDLAYDTDQLYDYVRTFANEKRPAPPIYLDSAEYDGVESGSKYHMDFATLDYRTTAVLDIDGTEYETSLSPSMVTSAGAVKQFSGLGSLSGIAIVMSIPLYRTPIIQGATSVKVTKINIYLRGVGNTYDDKDNITHKADVNNFYKIGEVESSGSWFTEIVGSVDDGTIVEEYAGGQPWVSSIWKKQFVVDHSIDWNITLSSSKVGVIPAYYSFDEESGTWNTVIYDYGQSPPVGNIFDVYAEGLSFCDRQDAADSQGVVQTTFTPRSNQTQELFWFFNPGLWGTTYTPGESAADFGVDDSLYERWRNLLIHKHCLKAYIKGTQYHEGDGLTWTVPKTYVPKNFVLIKATIDVYQERTQIKAIELDNDRIQIKNTIQIYPPFIPIAKQI